VIAIKNCVQRRLILAEDEVLTWDVRVTNLIRLFDVLCKASFAYSSFFVIIFSLMIQFFKKNAGHPNAMLRQKKKNSDHWPHSDDPGKLKDNQKKFPGIPLT